MSIEKPGQIEDKPSIESVADEGSRGKMTRRTFLGQLFAASVVMGLGLDYGKDKSRAKSIVPETSPRPQPAHEEPAPEYPFYFQEEKYKHSDPTKVAAAKERKTQELQEEFAFAERRSMPVPEKWEQFAKECESFFKEYYAALGIAWQPTYYRIFHEEGAPDFDLGKAPIHMPGAVIIYDQEFLISQCKNVIQALVIAHELYHNSAPAKYHFGKGIAGNVTTRGDLTRRGVVYETYGRRQRERGQSISALEDGMAKIVESKVLALARKHFPEEAEIWESYMEDVHRLHPQLPKESLFARQAWNPQTQEMDYFLAPIYPDSIRLTKFLADRISDFFLLVERARIKGETLALARTIESVFGRGAYRRIIEAGEDEAGAVLAELKGHLKRKGL